MTKTKQNILVLFGGASSEHEVSCVSAANIIRAIDQNRWNIVLAGITKDGRWLLAEDVCSIENGSWTASQISAELSPDACARCLIVTDEEGNVTEVPIDVCWPALHGKNGEDGTVQGLLELAQIPYVGCGVLASAVSMDKLYTKIIAAGTGVRQAEYVGLHDYELSNMDEAVRSVETKLSYPVFIKPSKAGSSCGVTKAHDRDELIGGLKEAARFDSKILVEEFIQGHEVECAVMGLGGGEFRASGIGEILAAAEFYDYDAKYNNPASETVIDPELPDGTSDEIRDYALKIFRAVDGFGLSRVDFFVTEDGKVIFNEINTMPGFTSISMYPSLWQARGIGKEELIAMLIESAFHR